MKICYNDSVNIDLGILKYLHPFDGTKFRKVYNAVKEYSVIEFISPDSAISQTCIDNFVDPLVQRYLKHKEHILRALEVPSIPFIDLEFLDRKILSPMRWGVGGTLLSAETALATGFCWNLAGGYHHASPHSIEGFCIYNDIGIAHQELIKNGVLDAADKILIIDTDAHHGNGNARTFMENRNITILDVYNSDIYPTTPSTRNRVDIPVALKSGTPASDYLGSFQHALMKVSSDFRLAFVVAGTDVLACDKLGGFQLSIDDVVQREKITIDFLKKNRIPGVMLTGGGYSNESSVAIARSIIACL